VPNPVEIINRTSRRIAQVAATRALAYAILPALVAGTMAATIGPLGRVTWERWGYMLDATGERIITNSLLAIGILLMIAGVAFACRAYLLARNFVGAAEQVDEAVGGHQQILTFAILTDPSMEESAKARRSPLFPLLWKSALSFLESLDPKRVFPLRLGRPITHSSMIAFAIAFLMVLATLGLVRPPSPLQRDAMKLREIAGEIEKSATTPGDIALAKSVRDAANALDNPKLPLEQKQKRLEEVMQQVASHGEQKQAGGNQSGTGSGSGGNKKNSNGNSSGPSQGNGSSSNSGVGAGENRAGKGSGQNDKNQQGKGNSIELQNELAKAEAQVETEEANNPNKNPSAGKESKGEAPQAGDNPNEKTPGSLPNPKQPGNISTQSAEATKNLPQAGGNNQQAGKDQGSNQGDTHLGEFPTPTKTQRFLKPGEKGDALNIHDARYVMFRIPSAIPVGSGGTTVIDPNRTKSATPYVNAPLKETSNDAPPDERQLVPPRYRDLIH